MVITRDVTLPEESALTVPEVDLSMATLLSAAPHLGKACEAINNEFMLCRHETRDPRACLDLGKKVTACTLDFFRSVKCSCAKEFNQYTHCVEKSSGDCSFSKCRKTQAVFDGCMEEKMGMVRPEFGYFTRARVHCTRRPAPEPERPADFPDATPAVPDSISRQHPRFGGRFYWMTE
ncbi:NADH dehydrogenase [ubiquinone] 1 alpha subcomplex subunit 8-like [Aricia agestis]|uniref:NADH dehydrogenase [ubiquinone] 1 alpha subcomplex subunit 8-like n=1 Tax=Aricia agestis TaxID=91739 RepID=UPI001C205D31|nr:NADH dehydrogenase [ubiquinone] 1 alpha subcomplex subunit 8-like [Aricia agestis]